MRVASRDAAMQWTLGDLVDFEALLALSHDTVDQQQRQHFLRVVRPRLDSVTDAAGRRRMGLRLWLEQRREQQQLVAGRFFGQALAAAGWAAFAVSACAGIGLVAGLVTGTHQAVHVVIFLGLTLFLPWLAFAAGLLARRLGAGRSALFMIMRMALRLFGGRNGHGIPANVLTALAAARDTRSALWAELVALTQRGAAGFNFGLILAFAGCLLLFDVRFYWAATPQTGMDAWLATLVQIMAAPWSWWWPQAVPDMAAIDNARLLAGTAPAVGGDGSWWRFLLMSLLTWGLLARLLLVALFRWQARRALARLDFQAPRHRALWRGLNVIERGEVASGPADGALVLDVGGHGVTGAMLRGFLLRRLRVNPLQTVPIAVLDDQDEAQAEQALAAGPAGVVLLVDNQMLSPRQIAALHQRVRGLLGDRVAMTWLVFALQDDGQPAAPPAADARRWARTIDGLRDPAAETAAYDA